ncbi:hypothetical protein MBM_01303 [Drepanopeziza brunnea f. sp. 'multigermtubi' MB_m1]|uniref:Uncharacterized protein n=1 Tax=Marssonina brunnea f. sp. multigermtubi (strain MB_m1) TaxID=1072389 RepID=K1X682_MARBU|nr:uncharacterized protein MBM_01303 [Drepanopeziza brunnea f. sp. 'multigermtubi' MB_m1]EKD20621.1 hypothetical protein MBM_01303 [Drepanopeziza brunnea f. sp. 'multigermtubi' MB_m1]
MTFGSIMPSCRGLVRVHASDLVKRHASDTTASSPPGVPLTVEDSGRPLVFDYIQPESCTGWEDGSREWEYQALQNIYNKTRDFDINGKRWSEESNLKTLNTSKKIGRPRAAAHCDTPTLNHSLILGRIRAADIYLILAMPITRSTMPTSVCPFLEEYRRRGNQLETSRGGELPSYQEDKDHSPGAAG